MKKINYKLILSLFMFSIFMWSVGALFLVIKTRLNIILLSVLLAHAILASIINLIMYSQLVGCRNMRKKTLKSINGFIVLYSILITVILFLLDNSSFKIELFDKQSIFKSAYISGYISYLILQIFSFYLYSFVNVLTKEKKYKSAVKTLFITIPTLIVAGVFYILTLNQYIVNYVTITLLIILIIPLFKYSNDKHKVSNLKSIQ